MITCKAAVSTEARKELEIQEIQVEPPREGEVRVKILYTGVCHTDEYTRYGFDPNAAFPCILGREGAGIVESIGEGVTTVQVGDYVIPCYIPQCKECKFCKSNKTNLCSKITTTQSVISDGTPRFKDTEGNNISFYGASTFSQYTVLPEICVAKISKESPLDKVCLFGDGITTGYGAVMNTLKVEEGATVMVVGLGGVGLAAIMGAHQVGASKIIGVDINTDKFKKAEEFGCTELINPADHKGKDLYEIIFEITDGIGVDYSIECVGTPHTMKQAFLSTKPNGGCSCIVGVAAAGQMIELNTEDIEGREWIGTTFGGAKSRDDIPELVEKYLNKEIKVDEFITHNFDLKDINKAFHVMHEGTCIKAIIKMFDDE